MRAGLFASLLLVCALRSAAAASIVLIGGSGSEGPARHDYANGVAVLQSLLDSLPEAAGLQLHAYPEGWPADPRAFDDVATIVLYADGLEKHPLEDPAQRQRFAQLMRSGVGVVALHQAFTIATEQTDLQDAVRGWLGAVRIGTHDRTTQTAVLETAGSLHPVDRGVAAFAVRDEFYPGLRFAAGALPLLTAELEVQHRAGVDIVDAASERVTVAWAWQRADGGRAVGYSGAHYLVALDQPMLRRTLLNAILWTARIEVPPGGAAVTLDNRAGDIAAAALQATPRADRNETAGVDATAFHADARRSGWHSRQPALTHAAVGASDFGLLWESPPLRARDGQPARLYATPLYVDRVRIAAGASAGETHSVVFAASNQGEVFAINAAKAGDVAAGRVLWRTRLAPPCQLKPAPLDGVATGVLSTPVIDVVRSRLYVTACDATLGWQAYAVDIGSGLVLPGWPLRLDEPALNAVNRNPGSRLLPPTRRHDFRVQRSALNLSPDGNRLYIGFGETETGWLVSVDTQQARIASAFAAVAMPHRGSGGIWGAGGPAVDADGSIHVVTGSGFNGYRDQAHDWTQSLLKFSDPAAGLTLIGTYTPFNHCATAAMDIDLGSGGVALLPAARTGQPLLLAIGGKQGNAYLLDRARLPGRLDRRPACGDDASRDASLLPPDPQPQFGRRGPLNVFGPYSEQDAALDHARARSTPAAFVDAAGMQHVFMTGNSKAATGSDRSVPPSLVRLEVVSVPRRSPYLRVAQREETQVFGNPGSPVVSSNGPDQAIVWVLDENAPRSASLAESPLPQPVLHAFEARSLKPLWRSAPGQLHASGKYNEPTFGRGVVVVGTDRIQAFGPGAPVRPVAVPTLAPATAAPVEPAVDPNAPVDAAALYRQRCAACHDNPTGNIPPRTLIAKRSRDQIIAALSHGVMRAQATGLDARAIAALADEIAK